MKHSSSSSSFFLFFFLLLLVSKESGAARIGAVDYWKTVMKDEAMPEIINGLIDEEIISDTSVHNNKFWSHFSKEFYETSNAIIYLPHAQTHKPKLPHHHANLET
ncbi:hypothetical protein vseg_006831 [Gypsophila vaccaria]